MKKEIVEEGMVVTKPRKIITVGHSKAVTLPKKWLDVQRWLGKKSLNVCELDRRSLSLARCGLRLVCILMKLLQ